MAGDETTAVTGSADPGAAASELAARVAERLAEARRTVPERVDVLAVTKGFGPEVIDAAVEAGLRDVGESYAQEVVAKRATIEGWRERGGLRVWFIGRLQTNKVRQLVGLVDVYASVDRASLVREIAKRDPGAAVLIQLNATGEEQKGGCDVSDADALVATALDAGLDVRGVLAMGPTDQPAAAAAPAFAAAVDVADRHGLAIRSLGMSGDLDVAVAAGSTQVRLGTALFGPRPARV